MKVSLVSGNLSQSLLMRRLWDSQSEGALNHPTTRESDESPRRQQLLPIDSHTLFGPLLGPRHKHLLGSRLPWTFDELYGPPKRLLNPTLALAFTPVGTVEPQVREAQELFRGPLE